MEIGTNKGASAEIICREALKYHDKVHYIGYDLFEDATVETDAREGNGKSHGVEAQVRERLSKIEGLTFELVRGDTRKTLHGTENDVDFVFIDGGHSVETIRGDYEAVKNSRLIVFDDYYTEGADLSKVGCNSVLEGVPHEVLPAQDNSKGLGIRFAVVGYSSKWAKAFDTVRQNNPIDSIVLWRPGVKRHADMVAAVNCLESLPDPGPTLEHIRAMCKKRFFFVLRADALRSLDWWRSELEKKYQIREWFGDVTEISGPSNEVVGTAVPLNVVGQFRSKGVMEEGERTEHVKENSKLIQRRLKHIPEPHNGTALIVCYGPSLNDTWPDLLSHLQFKGGDVFSVSGAHDFLLRKDIKPKYHVECDPRPHKAENLRFPVQGVEYLIASCCHPNLVKKLKDAECDITLWHMCNGVESTNALFEIEPDQPMVHGGGNAGLRAIAVAHVMGYRDFVIYGMDCSFKDDKQWAGPHVGKIKKDVLEVHCDGKTFKTSPVMISYTRHFFDSMNHAPESSFTLVGDGLLQSMLQVAIREQQKEKAA